MQDGRSEFEQSLDPNFRPGPSAIIEKPQVTTKEMDREALDHSRPLVVSFRCRFHAMEAWSSIKNILETCQVDQKTSAIMMEAMSTLAEAIDEDARVERDEKEALDKQQKMEVKDGKPAHLIGE